MLFQETSDTRHEDKERIQGTLFGRLLNLSTVKELDLKRVLAYPLTSVPLTFAHIDDLESTLFSKLKLMIITHAPRNVDVCIVIGKFPVQSRVDLPSTFCGVANVTLSRLVRRANRVDFAFCTYKYPPINDITREDHGLV